MNNFILRVANIEELDEIYNLYVERVKWFNSKDITQWKNYLIHHPKQEFASIIKERRLYVITLDSKIVGSVEIKFINKDFWRDDTINSMYIKKLVTTPGIQNIGQYVINYFKDVASYQNLNSIRLECEALNDKLNTIYYNYGFEFVDYAYKNNIKYCLRELVLN